MAPWTERDIPDQSGRTVLVTGANSGLGLRSARVLAAKGARVLLACRSTERGKAALRAVTGNAEFVQLDLADLASVRAAAERVRERTDDKLDVLMNNAGVMMTPRRQTADGFELQFGTNHLGHAALTWLLMPALRARPAARVVTVASLAARPGRMSLTDPHFEHRKYTPGAAYSQAKLANLLFALELDRRVHTAELGVISVAAHPGLTATELPFNMARSRGPVMGTALRIGSAIGARLFMQNVAVGALPQLYAATAPDVRGGEYFGPASLGQTRGYPRRVDTPPLARDEATASGLWDLSAKLTGVSPDPA